MFLQAVADCFPNREWPVKSQGSAKSGDAVQVQGLCCVSVLQSKAQQLPQQQQCEIADASVLARTLPLLSFTAGLQMPGSTQEKEIKMYKRDSVNPWL